MAHMACDRQVEVAGGLGARDVAARDNPVNHLKIIDQPTRLRRGGAHRGTAEIPALQQRFRLAKRDIARDGLHRRTHQVDHARWGEIGGLKRLFRSEEHTSELQSRPHLVCRLLLEKKKKKQHNTATIKIRKLKIQFTLVDVRVPTTLLSSL